MFGSKIFSKSFILSCFMMFGVSPDCLMIVKKVCSLILQISVILQISSFVMFLFFIFCFL